MRAEVLDDFHDVAAWMPVASGLAQLHLSAERGPRGGALRLDFDFKGGGGFVVARREFTRAMPESYAFRFAIRGAAPRNRLELKLADPSGRNVWWRHWDAFELPAEWQTIDLRSRDIEFAWGPAGGGAMSALGAVEFVITAPPGGAGTVWISDLCLEDRTYRSTPLARASSSRPQHPPAAAIDGREDTSWLSDGAAPSQWLELDFQEAREFGGLVIRWPAGREPPASSAASCICRERNRGFCASPARPKRRPAAAWRRSRCSRSSSRVRSTPSSSTSHTPRRAAGTRAGSLPKRPTGRRSAFPTARPARS
jgi:hypothetical protein